MLKLSKRNCFTYRRWKLTCSGFDPEKSFVVPDGVYDFYHKTAAKGAEHEKEWNELFKKYSEKFDKEAKELTRIYEKKLPEGWQKCLPVYSPYSLATTEAYMIVRTRLLPVESYLKLH
jgi:transketolase